MDGKPLHNQVGSYLFKVSNTNTRTMWHICSKITLNTPEQGQWRRSVVFIVNFEHISHIVLKIATAWKMSIYGVFSGPYFPAFRLSMERSSISLHIQSECLKIRTRKNPVFGQFSCSKSLSVNWISIIQPLPFVKGLIEDCQICHSIFWIANNGEPWCDFLWIQLSYNPVTWMLHGHKRKVIYIKRPRELSMRNKLLSLRSW